MTCIVGLEHDGDVYIGGDSAGVDEFYGLTVRADQKVFTKDRRSGRWAFGFCGSFRMGQLLRHALELPEPDPDRELEEFLVTTFVDNVRDCLHVGGWLQVARNREDAGTFVVGYLGSLFVVQDDLQVARGVDPYVAIGCGDHLALGAMHATADSDLGPVERIEAALRAAERFSAGVRSPFHVVSTADPEAVELTPKKRRR